MRVPLVALGSPRHQQCSQLFSRKANAASITSNVTLDRSECMNQWGDMPMPSPHKKMEKKSEQKQRDGDSEYCGCICFSFSCGCSGLPFAPSLCSATTGGPHISVSLKSGKTRCNDKQMSWIKCSSELFTKEMVDSCCTLSASKSTYNNSRGASVWLVNYLSSKSWKKCYIMKLVGNQGMAYFKKM